ncbi:helix-turn-helix domain-containing protein [Sorangium sp. So ce1151]|uniref:helix-turn-helix domain-containing protein n=1 Tax=Sorangium sp. So ce1151 TaxID=3133332 RepID=UPI003F5FA955
METIADRIRQVLAAQKISARELSRRAGLAESHIGLLLKKLDKDPLAVELKTLDAVAQGAGVTLAWLATGPPGPGDASGPPDPYPARAAAIAFARDSMLPETLRWAQETAPANPESLDRIGWLKAMLWHDDFLRGAQAGHQRGGPSHDAGSRRRSPSTK